MTNKTASFMKPNTDSIHITSLNLPTGILYKNNSILCCRNYWHKFIVTNDLTSPRNEILDAILNYVHPLDLIPVSFWRDSNGANFLARNCGPAIQKLCKDNLVVPNPKGSKPLIINIILKFATTADFTVDMQKNILRVLIKRYNTTTRVLNLVKFHEDQELSEYCPLSQPKIMYFVLHLTLSLVPFPEVYLMSDNGIKLLNPMETLVSQAANVRKIDLRNNSISDTDTLHHLKIFHLAELYLDGNPFCENISREEYVMLISNIVKDISTLDGVPVKLNKLHAIKKIYLCNSRAASWVNQFLEHYFYVYDSDNRSNLKELYDQNAMFSLNSAYHPNQATSADTRIHTYNQMSRNLHKLANLSMMHNNLYLGNQQIVNILSGLPATKHDPLSFTVDVMSCTNRDIIVSVSGVFKEVMDGRPIVQYGFFKTFVLQIVNNDGLSYIVNEQAHVYNALNSQLSDSFKIEKPILEPTNIPQDSEEQQQVIKALKMITNMNTKWSIKCLEECNYDLKKTLIMFVELFKQNRIPEDGFEHANKM